MSPEGIESLVARNALRLRGQRLGDRRLVREIDVTAQWDVAGQKVSTKQLVAHHVGAGTVEVAPVAHVANPQSIRRQNTTGRAIIGEVRDLLPVARGPILTREDERIHFVDDGVVSSYNLRIRLIIEHHMLDKSEGLLGEGAVDRRSRGIEKGTELRKGGVVGAREKRVGVEMTDRLPKAGLSHPGIDERR